MEALSSLLLRAREGGFISRFKVKGRGGEGKEVSHLPFANDTIAFARLLRIKSIIDGLLVDQRRVGMGLKSGFKKGLQCGRANTSLKGGGLQ
ncbi:hypothetical protein AAG906_003610 [Vitis piasezkii]